MSVWHNKYTAVKSGNSLGKSHAVARLVLLFLLANPNSYVITTATTFTQLSKVLWAEIARQFECCAVPIGGELLKMELTFSPSWRAFGISPREAVNVQGYHRPNILIIQDEANGVREELAESFKSLMTPSGAKELKIGNPTTPSGHFYRAFTEGADKYKNISISAFECPNVIEGRDVIPGLVTREWIEERRADWGEDSPLWSCFVLGEFPAQDDAAYIPLTLLQSAIGAEVSGEGFEALGCDVARSDHGDESVIAHYKDGKVSILEAYQGRNTMRTAGLLAKYYQEFGCPVGIDDIGVGGGVFDRCKEQGIPVRSFDAGSPARNKQRYANATAEAWSMVLEKLKDATLSLPDDPKLLAQLSSRRSTLKSTGQIVLESKDDMKRLRRLKSPDRADAVAIAIYTAHSGALMQSDPEPIPSKGWENNVEGRNEAFVV